MNKTAVSFTLPTSLAATIFAAACGNSKTKTPPDPPRPVITITVPERQETIRRTFSGLVDSVEGTGIAFEVGGRVVDVLAKEGESYQQEDILARLDTTELENQLNAARAQLTEAQQSLRRTQQLFETGNASRSQLETAIAGEQAASTNFKSAEKRVDDAVLTMPYHGVIGTVLIEEQMVVNAGQTAVTVQGKGGMEFEIGVPARSIGKIALGQESEISLGGIPGETFPGRVDSISPQVSENTTYPVTLTLLAEDKRIREGLDGEATIHLPNPNAKSFAIPAACVATTPDSKQFVWILTSDGDGLGVVNQRIVEVGELRPGGEIEILSGVTPGEVVVSRGVHSLDPGQKVKSIAAGTN